MNSSNINCTIWKFKGSILNSLTRNFNNLIKRPSRVYLRSYSRNMTLNS